MDFHYLRVSLYCGLARRVDDLSRDEWAGVRGCARAVSRGLGGEGEPGEIRGEKGDTWLVCTPFRFVETLAAYDTQYR